MSHANDAMETDEARKFAGKAARATARATETDEDRQKRLADRRAYYAKSRALKAVNNVRSAWIALRHHEPRRVLLKPMSSVKKERISLTP